MNEQSKVGQFLAMVGGAGHGAEAILPALAQLNQHLVNAEIFLAAVDPVRGLAERFATLAQELGVKAIGGEEHIENLVFEGRTLPPIILAVDRAAVVAQVIINTNTTGQMVAGLLLVKTHQGNLFGVRFLLRASDTTAREQAITLFQHLSAMSLRQGSETVWGKDGQNTHRVLEPVFRNNYGTNLARDLQKALFRLEPECYPLEISTNGRDAHPLIVRTATKFCEPEHLLEELPLLLYLPLGRGQSVVVAEIVEQEMRLQRIRRRLSDDRFALSEIFDAKAVTLEDDVRQLMNPDLNDVAVRELERLRDRLKSAALSFDHPVTTTD